MYPGLVNFGNFVNFLDLDLPNTHVQPTVHTLLKWRQFYVASRTSCLPWWYE